MNHVFLPVLQTYLKPVAEQFFQYSSRIGLVLGVSISLVSPALANNSENSSTFPPTVLENSGPFGRSGTPPQSDGAGSRGGCPDELISAMPTLQTAIDATRTHLAIWVYIPFELKAGYQLRSRLQSADNTTIYEQEYSGLTANPGLLVIPLPIDAATEAMNVSSSDTDLGVSYTWQISLYCEPPGDAPPAQIEGRIHPVVASSSTGVPDLNAITELTPQAASDRYASQQLWYNAIAVLGNALIANPNDPALEQAFTDLLM